MISFDYNKIVKDVWIRCYNIEQATHLLKWAKWNYFKMEDGEDIDIDNPYWDYSNRFMAYSFSEGKVAIKTIYDKSISIIEWCDAFLCFSDKKVQEVSNKKYKLTKNIPKKRYYEVTIEADSNDADYVSETECYYQEQFDEIIDDLIDLKNNYSGRHELENYNGEELSLPYSDYGRCHTLYGINIMMYDTDGCSYIVEIKGDD